MRSRAAPVWHGGVRRNPNGRQQRQATSDGCSRRHSTVLPPIANALAKRTHMRVSDLTISGRARPPPSSRMRRRGPSALLHRHADAPRQRLAQQPHPRPHAVVLGCPSTGLLIRQRRDELNRRAYVMAVDRGSRASQGHITLDAHPRIRRAFNAAVKLGSVFRPSKPLRSMPAQGVDAARAHRPSLREQRGLAPWHRPCR